MATRPRTRLAPDARRDEILEHARQLFGARSYAAVSASEIARAAGVTPALVSHYFPGGKRDIFLSLVAQLREQVPHTIRVDPSLPVRERITASIENWLRWLEANSQTWLATAAQGDSIADPDLQALVDSAREVSIDTIITDYADVLTDDHSTRLALRSWLGLNRATSRSWLKGDATRAEAALLLGETLHHLITTLAPALTNLNSNNDPATTADAKTPTTRSHRRRAGRP
jgi:AcrR family transcriptional regulator